MSQFCDIEEIKSILPHREPMLLIDDCTIEDDGSVTGHYRIKEDEFFTRGHFPGNPMVPGVIQCEIMAQTCSMLVRDYLRGHIAVYAGLENARFKNMVRPGDLCEIKAVLKNTRDMGTSRISFCSAILRVDGKICCKADMNFALLPNGNEQLNPEE